MNRRVLREIQKAIKSDKFAFYYDETGVFGEPFSGYLRFRPEDPIFMDQIHVLRMKFKYGSNRVMEYPTNPPYIKWITPIWHANINAGGVICLDILKEDKKWSSSLGIESIFQSLTLLLICPNPDDPLNGAAAKDLNSMSTEQYKVRSDEYYHNNLNEAVQALLESTLFQ